jgi:hypothetical protein
MPGRRTDHEHHATLEGPANTNRRLRHQKDGRRTLRSAPPALFRGFALSWPRFLLALIVLFAANNFGFGLLLYLLRFGLLAKAHPGLRRPAMPGAALRISWRALFDLYHLVS